MKIKLDNPYAAKALIAFAVLMAILYLAGGVYFLIAGIQQSHWPGVLTGASFILYGSFRSYRSYQKHNESN